MRPQVHEILRSVLMTFEETLMPAISGAEERSAAATVRNLIAYAMHRADGEYGRLHAGLVDVSHVLGEVAAFFEDCGIEDAAISGLLPRLHIAARRGGAAVADPAAALQDMTNLLDDALQALQDRKAEFGGSAAYRAIRKRIRAYLASSLEAEGAIVAAAFVGARR